MKITHRGPADADVTQPVRSRNSIGHSRHSGDTQTEESSNSSRINISHAARELQKIAELTGLGDELRAKKVEQIKTQLDQGTYKPDPTEVAKSILRFNVTSLLDKE